MKRTIILGLLATLYICGYAQLSFTLPSGEGRDVISINADAATGLDGGIHVVPSTSGLRMTFASSSPVKWSRYSTLGAAYAEEIAASGGDGSSSWIDSPQGDMGYVIESGGKTTYLWMVDYSRHRFEAGQLSLAPVQDCGTVTLDCTGRADEIDYYSITGRRYVLSREIALMYNTLTWDENVEDFIETETSKTLASLSAIIYAPAPLCPTPFTLEGDRFLRSWGDQQSFTTVTFEPRSIDAHTSAVAEARDNDNETTTDTGGMMGGSAPCTITFAARVTDAAIFHEWQFSRQSDFADLYLHAPELEITHTFTERGTFYVRLYCANADASCEYFGETYQIAIGESMLKCPNAFTPFNRDGVNDVWKVSYSSIVSFECHIFNRNGRKIITLTDPSQGWDGTYGGKNVPTGAYYYVIKAKGADGHNYNLSGDINIIEYK